MLVASLSDLKEDEGHTVTLDDYPLLHEYVDVFLDESLGMQPHCDIDFWIDLVPGVEPIS